MDDLTVLVIAFLFLYLILRWPGDGPRKPA